MQAFIFIVLFAGYPQRRRH